MDEGTSEHLTHFLRSWLLYLTDAIPPLTSPSRPSGSMWEKVWESAVSISLVTILQYVALVTVLGAFYLVLEARRRRLLSTRDDLKNLRARIAVSAIRTHMEGEKMRTLATLGRPLSELKSEAARDGPGAGAGAEAGAGSSSGARGEAPADARTQRHQVQRLFFRR